MNKIIIIYFIKYFFDVFFKASIIKSTFLSPHYLVFKLNALHCLIGWGKRKLFIPMNGIESVTYAVSLGYRDIFLML